MMTESAAQIVLDLARACLANGIQRNSAAFCIRDAEEAMDRGNYDSVYSWALKSLRYSVGILSDLYPKVEEFAKLTRTINVYWDARPTGSTQAIDEATRQCGELRGLLVAHTEGLA